MLRVFDGSIPDQILARTKHPDRAPIWQSPSGPAGGELVHQTPTGPSFEQVGIFDPMKVGGLLAKSTRFGALGEIDLVGLVGVLTA